MSFANMKVYIIFVICCAYYVQGEQELPDFIKVCHKNRPNFTDCIIESAESIRPHLVTGVPEYNIPSLEPLIMDELISEKSGGLQITAKNVKVFGASNFNVKGLKVDFKNQKFVFDVFLPQLKIQARYGIDGQVLLVPIKGSGPMTANVTNCIGRVVLQGQLKDGEDGEKHLQFTSMNIKVKVGAGKGHLENLFNGDRVLGTIVNEAINKNFDLFLKELLPVIEDSLSKVFLDIANNIVSPFTYKQLFPED